MKTALLLPLLACAMSIGLAGCKHHNGPEDVENKQFITKGSVPAKVSTQFDKDYPGSSITKIEQETYKDGTIHYEFKFYQNGTKHEAEYNAAGERIED